MTSYEFFKGAKEKDINLKGLPYPPHGHIYSYKVFQDKVVVTTLDGTVYNRLKDNEVDINLKSIIKDIFESLKI